ncbi:hypothetical protein ACFVQ3_14350 [Oerskovia sp. NPDC057915]|uniref:hypothetical protein n=1 Tax=Oerskovia sp. NPDC057915 TaxID=3346280 RepID=UPI0036DFA062
MFGIDTLGLCEDSAMNDALANAPRRAGGRLTPQESALLERICAGTWRGAEEARAQLAHARWGGKDHDGDACFLIDIPAEADAPRIPQQGGGPIATLAVSDRDVHLGSLELWVEGGQLHSLDYSTFSDAGGEMLPDVRQLGDFTSHIDEQANPLYGRPNGPLVKVAPRDLDRR